MAVSLGRKIGVAAKNEAVEGVAETLDQAADSLLMYENVNPVAIDTQRLDIVPLRPSLTLRKSIIGRQLQRFSGITYLQGAESLATSKPWRFGRLLRACGLQETISAGSSVVYKPRSSGFESATIGIWVDGWKHLLTSTYGTFTMEAAAGEGCRVTFDMMGLYNAPTEEAIPAQTLEVFNPPTFKGAVATIESETMVLKSFRFTAGVTVSERKDANAADGLKALMITAREPTLDMTIEVDIALRNYFADLRAATTHNIALFVGTATGNKVKFEFPEAQPVDLPYGDDVGLRTHNISYRLQSATDEGEYTLRFQ